MKKMTCSLLAIVFAVAGLAFTNNARKVKFAPCDDQLIWYVVNAGAGVLAANLPTLAQLNLNQYDDLNAFGSTPGDGAVTSADFSHKSNYRLKNELAAKIAFNCIQTHFVCAVGFYPTTTNFQIVSGKVQPKSIANVVCKIYRNQS